MSRDATKTLMEEEDDPYAQEAAQDLMLDGLKKLIVVRCVSLFLTSLRQEIDQVNGICINIIVATRSFQPCRFIPG